MTLEASLPRLRNGENATLLTDWAEVTAAAAGLVARAADAAGGVLPPLDDWTVRRIDAVWSWEYPPAPYLQALVLASVPRCTPARYPTGQRWALPGGGVYGRAYDKAAEARAAVPLPLRLERQARPPRNVVTVDGCEVSKPWGAWGAQTALGLVREFAGTVGLDRPVRTPLAARAALVDAHGIRAGGNVFRRMLEAREAGGWHATGASAQTRRRCQRMAAAAGVVGLADVELPALPMP